MEQDTKEQENKAIKMAAMINMMEMAYATFLRQILVDYTKGTPTEWDDRMIIVLDGIFGYRK